MPYSTLSVDDALLGYNMQSKFNDLAWLQRAADGGARLVRYQPGWEAVEDYATGVLALTGANEAALARCGELELHPVLVASYGPPRAQVATLTVTAPVAAGGLTIPVSGDLAGVDPPNCHVLRTSNAQIVRTGKWAYYGALIHSKNENAGTITLAAVTSVALAAGDTLRVNRLRYPSLDADDPASQDIQAYLRYARFLADRIAAHGCRGYVCLWNEAPWTNDGWHNRLQFYDATAVLDETEGEFDANVALTASDRLTAIVRAAIDIDDLPPGVRFINGASDKTGSSGLLANAPASAGATPEQIAGSVVADGIHPYGDWPEKGAWDTGVASFPALNPADNTSNFRALAKVNADYRAFNAAAAPSVIATELGKTTTDDDRQAVYLVRRVASLWGMGVPAIVYSLGENNNYRVCDTTTGAPRPAYTALQRLMELVADISPGGALAIPNTLPALVGAPDAPYPPIVVGIYGTNGAVLLAWQRTYPAAGGAWAAVEAPAPITVQFAMPPNVAVAEVTDLLTGDPGVHSLNGALLDLSVTESVVAVRTAAA